MGGGVACRNLLIPPIAHLPGWRGAGIARIEAGGASSRATKKPPSGGHTPPSLVETVSRSFPDCRSRVLALTGSSVRNASRNREAHAVSARLPSDLTSHTRHLPSFRLPRHCPHRMTWSGRPSLGVTSITPPSLLRYRPSGGCHKKAIAASTRRLFPRLATPASTVAPGYAVTLAVAPAHRGPKGGRTNPAASLTIRPAAGQRASKKGNNVGCVPA